MDWNTIIAVVIGGLIAIVPTIINNIYQAKQRKEDREEDRKDARILAREKWIERDILAVINTVDDLLRMLSKYRMYKVNIDFIIGVAKVRLFAESEIEVKRKWQQTHLLKYLMKQFNHQVLVIKSQYHLMGN